MGKNLEATYRYWLAAAFLIAAMSGFGQSPSSPNIDCVTVSNNGDIILTWSTPADPNNEFVSYQLFWANPNTLDAVFIQDIFNYNTTSIVVTAYNGNASAHCFYLQTTFNNGVEQVAEPSEFACSMHLVVNASIIPGLAQLGWNFPYITDPTLFGGQFNVLREYPAGVWTTIATLPYALGNNIYEYQVDICEADLNFQIRFSGGTPCSHFSNIDGGTFQDQIDPSPPVISSASVDVITNDAVLSWSPSPEPDLFGYIVYQCFPGLNPIPLDTIWDASITTWTNPNSMAEMGSEYYNIAAFDSCFSIAGQPDPGPASLNCENTIFLTHDWQPCTDFVNLIWTPYTGWDGVMSYEIFATEEPNPGSGVFLPTISIGSVNGAANTFVHENCTLGSSYRYRVVATSSDLLYTSTSNRRTATLFYPAAPAFNYISGVNVLSGTEVEINVQIGPGAGTEHTFLLERQRANLEDFDIIDAQTLIGEGGLQFSDEVTDTGERSYTYRITVENTCDDFVDQSNIGTSLLLTGVVNRDRLVNTLFWTAYKDWDNGVQRYEIFRSTPDQPSPVLLATVPGGVLFLEDDVSQLLFSEGEFCYLVRAIEQDNGYSPPGSSDSNERCLTQEPVIWVPNAFLINGFNNTFQPVISFADFDNYRLQVYSRWGDLVFETYDIDEAWNGIYRDELVPEGLYAWFVSVTDGSGRIYEKRGTVFMMVGPED